MLANIRIILLHTSHSGNVGSVARAMKVMGLGRLYLVNPQCDHLDGKAKALACGGVDILEKAQVLETFNEALTGVELVYGTSARMRSFAREVHALSNIAPTVIEESEAREVAVVFGSEKHGMSNEEIDRCHHHIWIPTEEEYGSLNLSQAVQIVVYELRIAELKSKNTNIINKKETSAKLASADQLDGLYQHLEQIMRQTGFYKADHPRGMETRLRQLFNRALIDEQDINLLRGILTSVEMRLPK